MCGASVPEWKQSHDYYDAKKWTNEPKLVLGIGLEENVVLGMGYVNELMVLSVSVRLSSIYPVKKKRRNLVMCRIKRLLS